MAAVLMLAVSLSKSQPALATEFEGFGPVNFGMTRERAWDAIKWRGEWVSRDRLKYVLSLEYIGDVDTFEVLQEFRDGRASDVRVLYEEKRIASLCIAKGLQFVGAVTAKYAVRPIQLVHDPRRVSKLDKEPQHIIEDFYVFLLEGNASIRIRFTDTIEQGACKIVMTYRAPHEAPNPF